MSELNDRNYKAVVNRGLITVKTKYSEFIDKLKEEYKEVIDSLENREKSPNHHTIEELGDLKNVINNIFLHYNIDDDSVMKSIAAKNEYRCKKQ